MKSLCRLAFGGVAILASLCFAEPETFEVFNEPWTAQGVLQFPFYSFYLGAPDVQGVAYLPNFSPKLGPRISYKHFGGKLTFSLPLPKEESERRGQSTQTSFILSRYDRHTALDVYYQRYRGFYVDSPLTELSTDRPDRFPQLPDAVATNYGVNWYRVFYPERYSLRAAFATDEFQLVSGGSWVMMAFYNHLEMDLGSVFLPGSDPKAQQQAPNLQSGTFDTLGWTAGYGYTWVYDRYFVNGQGVVGPGLQYQQIGRSSGNDIKWLTLAGKTNINVAAGYHWGSYVVGIKGLADSIWARVQETQLASSLFAAEIFAGGRF